MATHTQLPIYKVAYDLLDVATDLVKNMPRDFKQSIGGKINSECVEIVVLIFRANCAQDKAPHLLELIERLQVAELLIRLAKDKRLISQGALLANVLRKRGHSIKGDLTKTYRKKGANAC